MVIDSSALIAILLGEPEASALAQAISNDQRRLLSAVSALETAIVIETRKGPAGVREFDLLVHQVQIEIEPGRLLFVCACALCRGAAALQG